MNDITWTLVIDVVNRVQQSIRMTDYPAIVILDADRRQILSDYDYVHGEHTRVDFETRAADRARALHARRFTLAVPQIIEMRPDGLQAHPFSVRPLRDGEQECVVWTAYDATDGVDYGWAPHSRRPDGQPVFDEPSTFHLPARPGDGFPGLRLLQLLTDE
ncbi:conserved hypothetical protein [Frankia sp. AiPs1]|uniref:hypothetical protein n=1 Tax=Frankia sp. AiPa1 TaxID=573492 RepID=UPI00202AD4C1|nr:hypothetical protein [Frankia sp. AiPa1]MCL9758640.1 hypothetical protein [Frankia sp. AiPa1]